MNNISTLRQLSIKTCLDTSHVLTSPKNLYFALLAQPNHLQIKNAALNFLKEQFFKVKNTHYKTTDNNLLKDANDLEKWVVSHTELVGLQYQAYLKNRKNGKPRLYFSNKSHALNFIKSVAPTKMVDGAWLYGITQHWQDARFSDLIKIYLEELGDGVAAKNHVVIYQKLLKTYGLEHFNDLPDSYFVQGAIQLALACHAEQFIPEIIGFNLGYEQLPLHLLITAYELKELNIDPHYFNLHVTIDNALTGHANSAVKAVIENLPQLGCRQDYMQRINCGFQLNNQGLSTLDIVNNYDIKQELIAIFRQKATVGQYMHNNHCQLDGRSINQWLSVPDKMHELLQSLEKNKWFLRHQDPQNSRFWKLIDGDQATMFGVFNAYEKQVLYDWIAGDELAILPKKASLGESIFAHKRLLNTSVEPAVYYLAEQTTEKQSNVYEIKKNGENGTKKELYMKELHSEEDSFKAQIALITDKKQRMQKLLEWLTPANHHTPIGLLATRLYKQQLDV